MNASATVEATRLSRLLGLWTDDEEHTPLPRRLATALEDLIAVNLLADGAALPAQRILAEALGVSRSTITEAYEILEGRGLVESRRGSGTRVRHAGSPLVAAHDEGRMSSFTEREGSPIDLSSGALPGMPAVADAFAALDREFLARIVASDGYVAAGLPELRCAVAGRYAEAGLPSTPDQVLVTSGAQQALWLAARLLISPGDEILVEDPSYRGAIEAFQACGARITVVPVRDDGLDLDLVARLLPSHRFRALYLQPIAHNPTGTTMPQAQRRRLAELASQHGVFLIEDRCSADLMLRPVGSTTPVAVDMPEDSSLVIGTASKLFWGGLRVGWIRASGATIKRLVQIRQGVDLAGAPVEQAVVASLLRRDRDIVEARRAALRASLDGIEELLRHERPDWRWRSPSGGVGLWVDTGEDAVAMTSRARRHGVLLVPGPAFSAVDGFTSHLRLPLGHPIGLVAAGLARLSA